MPTASRLKVLAECRPGRRPRPRDLRGFAGLFKAIGDQTRMEIVTLVAEAGELCACDIEAHFDLSQPTISHHLKVLREAGWLSSERKGSWVHYSLDRHVLEQVSTVTRALGGS